MKNPILQALNSGAQAPIAPANPAMAGLQGIAQLKNIMRGNPTMVMQNMLQSNPQFAKFVQQNRGKSPEQIAQEYGLDLNLVRQALR
jgi:hypothetical protein